MMCTPFLVYTYVIHTNIALNCVFTIACLRDCTFSPTIFKLPLGVCQRYIQLMCTTLLEFHWNITHWHMVAWMMDLHLSGIPTYYHEDGMPRYIRFTIMIFA